MKKETQITKENIEKLERCGLVTQEILVNKEMETHKASCQRFLDRLKERRNLNNLRKVIFNEAVIKQDDKVLTAKEMINFENKWLDSEIIDRENAIKLYDEAGI